MSLKVLVIGIIISISAIISTFSMKWIFPKISEFLFKRIGYFAMTISGGYILYQAIPDIYSINDGSLRTDFYDNSMELKLEWKKQIYSFEFTYNEGFEFEQIIPMNQLSNEQIDIVNKNSGSSDTILIEVVYSIKGKSYEAYYFQKNELIDKIYFR